MSRTSSPSGRGLVTSSAASFAACSNYEPAVRVQWVTGGEELTSGR